MSEIELSPLFVYSARPTFRFDDQKIEGIDTLILSMDLRERQGGLSALEMRLMNLRETPNGARLATEDLGINFGTQVAVYSGDEFGPMEIFRGPVTGFELEFSDDRAPEVVVLAEDALQQARMKRISKTYEDLKLEDLLNDIASDTGLTPKASELSQSLGTQIQMNETMTGFLRRLAERYDSDVQVSGSELQGSPTKTVRRTEVELEMHQQLRSARVLADLSHQVTEVSAGGWDPKQAQKVFSTSTGANPGPGAGRKGSEIFDTVFGKRSEHLGQLAVTTAAEAQALADSAFDQRARSFVTLHGTAEGNPRIRVGTHLKVTGLDKRFDNTYYVTSAHHRWDLVDGYQTHFVSECAFLGGN